MLDLKSKSCCIFGLPDSGKSTLAHYIADSFGSSAFVFDTLNEFPDQPFDRYAPSRRGDIGELEKIARAVMASRRYSCFILDEANRYCPSKPVPLPQAIADLNDFRAHYELTTIFIARRPVQLNQDLTELAHYLLLFRLPGRNDIGYLNELATGLGDAVQKVPKYHFMCVHPDRTFNLMKPVQEKFKTNKIIKAQPVVSPPAQ
jgi:hypothetical protein